MLPLVEGEVGNPKIYTVIKDKERSLSPGPDPTYSNFHLRKNLQHGIHEVAEVVSGPK